MSRSHRPSPRVAALWALVVLTVVLTVVQSGPVLAAATAPPNLLIITADDLGWGDVGCNGATFNETPAIDGLAAAGVRFTQGYAASPVCSPTRASLLTGKHPGRTGTLNHGGGYNKSHAAFAEALHAAGYQTVQMGKWHVSVGTTVVNGVTLLEGFEQYVTTWDYLGTGTATDPKRSTELSTLAVNFLRSGRDGRPFCLMVGFTAPHVSIRSRSDDLAYFTTKAGGTAGTVPLFESFVRPGSAHTAVRQRISQNDPVYAGMVRHLDRGIASVLAELTAQGLDSSTLVVFLSDNGPYAMNDPEYNFYEPQWGTAPATAAPLSGGKSTLFEGGVRVPFLLRWPGQLPAGAVRTAPVVSMDVFPTLLSAAGLPLQPTDHVDGLSLLDYAKGGAAPARDELYFAYPAWHEIGNEPCVALRKGDLKIIRWLNDGREAVYDLATDPGERKDLAASRPADRASLATRLDAWIAAVGGGTIDPGPTKADVWASAIGDWTSLGVLNTPRALTGPTLVVGEARQLGLTLHNDGTTPLTLSAPSVTISGSATVHLDSTVAGTTEPGLPVPVRFTVTATGVGTYTATFTCTTSDTNETTPTITVSGSIVAAGTPTAPWITPVADQAGVVGVGGAPIPLTIGDATSPVGSLSVTATSSAPAVLPPAGIVVGGSGADRTLTLTPTAVGTTLVTVTVSDGGLSTTDTFQLTVGPVVAVRPGDLNGDRLVNLSDLTLVTSHFGQASPTGDANADGLVNLTDLVMVTSRFGQVY